MTESVQRSSRIASWFVGAGIVLAAAALAAPGDTGGERVLTAAVPRDAPPNYLLDSDGRPTGFGIELMELIATRANVKVRYRVEENWSAAIEALRAGRADLIPNLGITPAREGEFAFTAPVETFRISTFVRSDTYDINSLSDLRGRKVAVVRANAAEDLLKTRTDIRLTSYPDFPDALFALLSGNVDALVYPEPWTWKRAKAARVAAEIKVVGEPLVELKRALAVRRADAELLARLAPVVERTLATPAYRELYAKWIGSPEPFWTVARLAGLMVALLFASVVIMGIWRYRTIARVNLALKTALADRERAEQRLADSELRFARALEAAGMGGWDWQIVPNRVTWSDNVEGIFGMAPGTFQKTFEAFLELVVPEDRERVRGRVRSAVEQGNEYRVEYRIATPAGAIRWLASFGQVYYDPAGKPLRMSGTVWDITEQKQAELERERLLQELEQRNAEMESFVYTISHDLKAPLVTIAGFAKLLGKDLARGEAETARDSLAEIDKAAAGMQGLIEDLLTLSRTGKILAEPEEVDLEAMLGEQRARFASQIERERATIRVHGPLPRLRVDRERLGQVLQNLIDNALKFHRPGVAPVIDIGTERGVGTIRIYLRDNGIGIKKPYQEKIFGLFQRLDTRIEGTGVGLSIARRVVEQHGGRLTVESEPGSGSTFWIELPDSAIVEQRAGQSEGREATIKTGRSK